MFSSSETGPSFAQMWRRDYRLSQEISIGGNPIRKGWLRLSFAETGLPRMETAHAAKIPFTSVQRTTNRSRTQVPQALSIIEVSHASKFCALLHHARQERQLQRSYPAPHHEGARRRLLGRPRTHHPHPPQGDGLERGHRQSQVDADPDRSQDLSRDQRRAKKALQRYGQRRTRRRQQQRRRRHEPRLLGFRRDGLNLNPHRRATPCCSPPLQNG